MKLKRYYLVLIFLMVLMGLYILTPLDFYVQKYANRLLSYNPTPVEEREKETVTEFDWTLKGMDGNTFKLKDHKGEVLFINFWATWCPPCVAEMPSLQDLHNDYQDKITFLFVARDKNNRVTNFIERKGYELPVYFESGLTPKILYHPSLPTTYIINKKGGIELAKTGASDWNSDTVRKLLDSLLIQ